MEKDFIKNTLRRLRDYEIRIRKAVDKQMQGDYKSVFKGTGIEFDDIRQYQYGDDVRTIHWKASAKGHGVYVKTFKEEKEQTVFFLVDVSASQEIGTAGRTKLTTALEIAGVLAIAASKEDSQTGLICFTDQKEKLLKPSKDQAQPYRIILELLRLKPQSKKTDLQAFIRFSLNIINRKSMVIFISDFLDSGYEQELAALANKHDLVLIHIYDSKESDFPRLGIIPLYEKETGKTIWVNTGRPTLRRKISNQFHGTRMQLTDLAKRYNFSYVSLDTSKDFVPELIKLFKARRG